MIRSINSGSRKIVAVQFPHYFIYKNKQANGAFDELFSNFKIFSDWFFYKFLRKSKDFYDEKNKKKMIKRLYEIYTVLKQYAKQDAEDLRKDLKGTLKANKLKTHIKSIIGETVSNYL